MTTRDTGHLPAGNRRVARTPNPTHQPEEQQHMTDTNPQPSVEEQVARHLAARDTLVDAVSDEEWREIGRASCRERV